MKQLFLVFFLLTFCKAQDQQYWLLFDYSPSVDVESYKQYYIELSDTLLTPFHKGDSADGLQAYLINTVSEDLLKSNNPDTGKIDFIDSQNGLYIQCGLTATKKDTVSNVIETKLAVSNFYKKEKWLEEPVIISIIKGD